MPKKIAKAYEISNARINFVSLVNKAANKHQFLIVKADDGNATFQTFGRIVKADTESHYVTGIVYEPMVEDSQGNYMTEEEIAKAAHWFMKMRVLLIFSIVLRKQMAVKWLKAMWLKVIWKLMDSQLKRELGL